MSCEDDLRLRLAVESKNQAALRTTTTKFRRATETPTYQGFVETMGLEPTTLCLQSRCSSQLSYVPEAHRSYRTGRLSPPRLPQLARRNRDR